jgi:apolipoprotein N-acyltransferase
VPFSKWLPVLKWLTPITGEFASGHRPGFFSMGPPRVRMGLSICFEDVFANLARDSVDADTDFLLNLTNDGWFGEGAAQWQQAAHSVFRAVENRVPVVRCTNNGLTWWIDEWGRIRDVYLEDAGSIYAEGFKTVRLPLLGAGNGRSLTFDNRHGDVLGWGCVLLATIWIGLGGRRRPSALDSRAKV